MKKHFFVPMIALGILFSGVTARQAEAAKALDLFKDIQINGFLDTYYSYNTSNPKARSAFGKGETNRYRAFDVEDDTLVVDNIEIQIEKEVSKESRAGFKVITNYGELANRITFSRNDDADLDGDGLPDGDTDGDGVNDSITGRVDDDDFTFSVAYANYLIDLGTGIDIKVGKMATWIGSEPWESVDNHNYSRSLLYQNGDPFTHTGASVSYNVNDMFGLTGYIVNGWDTFEDNNRAKSLGYSLSLSTKMVSFLFNGIHGAEKNDDTEDIRNVFDFVLDITPIEALVVNVNVIIGQEDKTGRWNGISTIVAYDFTDWFKLAVRGEIFEDKAVTNGGVTAREISDDGTGTGTGVQGYKSAQVNEVTVTGTFKLSDHILVRPEYRQDWSTLKLFDGGTKKTQETWLTSVAYIF